MSTPPPAGWFQDPQSPAQMRYWDGAAWTAHVAPAHGAPAYGAPAPGQTAAQRRGLSAGVIIAIVAAVLAPILIGMLAAVAIPLYLNQKEKAAQGADQSARDEAWMLATFVVDYQATYDSVPQIEVEGAEYVISNATGEYTRTPVAQGVSLVEYSASDFGFCVATEAAEGEVGTVHVTEQLIPTDGPCP